MATETDVREAFAERLLEDTTRSLETLSVHLGVTLGLYRAVADLGRPTFPVVANRAGIAPRYAREWLEQQATAGYLECVNPSDGAEHRRYRLPPEHAEVLLDSESPYYVGATATMFAGVAGVVRDLVAAYRTGAGVPYAAYGEEIRQGISALNRPLFRNELAGWLAALPHVDERLRSEPPARVLDLGCGRGQSCISLAQTYPRVAVHGVDLDQESINEARADAAAAGVADRVTFTAADAAQVATPGSYDLVTMFETLHDMGDPVGALRMARAALSAGGSVFIGDDKVADAFTAPGDLLERFQFGFSVLHCLPATMAEDPVEANGTMLRASTVERWAGEAGFAEFAVAPIENDFWRFYVMRG